jgi:TM2 domain-containing membrane protein YozV
MKSKVVAYLLWFFLGVFSAHRFYLKKYNTAIFYLITLQLLGIAWIIDAFILGEMVDRFNLKRGHYGPAIGLDKSIIINFDKTNPHVQQSRGKHSVAS